MGCEINGLNINEFRKQGIQNNYNQYEPREDDSIEALIHSLYPMVKDFTDYRLVKREDLIKWFKRIEHFLKVATEGEIPLTLAYPRWKFDLIKDEEEYNID